MRLTCAMERFKIVVPHPSYFLPFTSVWLGPLTSFLLPSLHASAVGSSPTPPTTLHFPTRKCGGVPSHPSYYLPYTPVRRVSPSLLLSYTPVQWGPLTSLLLSPINANAICPSHPSYYPTPPYTPVWWVPPIPPTTLHHPHASVAAPFQSSYYPTPQYTPV